MTTKANPLSLFAGLFLVSAAVLHLEILQTRIFSVMLWHHVTYLVVTFTLLGFAAAGAFVAVRPSLLKGDLALKLAINAALFGITAVGAFVLLTLIELDTVDLLKNRFQYFILFIYYLYLIVPYFFGGLVIVLLLSAKAKDVNRLYFVNLFGSGVGCLVFLPVIWHAGGSGSILVVAVITFVGALCFASGAERRAAPSAGCAILTALAVAAVFFADKVIPIQPAPSKVMSVMVNQEGGIIEETRWDPLCRIDVVKHAATGVRNIYQDGDAPTVLMRWNRDGNFLINHYSLAYFIQDKPKVLVIGVGGGQDLVQALGFHASSVTGAEINPSIHALMSEDYDEQSGHLYTESGAEVVVAEGRSFLRRSEETYDVIQMTGTDTYSALSSGAFILSESYLYTREAFQDYLDHLTDNGVVAVLRFRFYPPRECLRLVSIAARAMKDRGIAEPSRHILVVSYNRPPEVFQGKSIKISYAVMIFKKTPFTPGEVQKYERFCTQFQTTGEYVLSYAPGREGGEPEFRELLAAADRGEEKGFFGDYLYDVSPVSDDRPFFFAYHKWRTIFDQVKSPTYHGMIGEDPVGLYILLTVLVETTLLVGLLVLFPLFVYRRKGLKVPSSGRIVFYFFSLGISYLFIEIASMQKFVLFLGHPTYSLSIVLFSFLLFSGLGSLFSQRFKDTPMKGIGLAVVTIAVLLVLYQFLLPLIFAQGLQAPVVMRMGITVVLLAPLAFFMGIPFPLGIRVVDQRSPDLIPWAFGINGGASVVSSVVSIVVAMVGGFTSVYFAAGLLYLLGWWFFKKLYINNG